MFRSLLLLSTDRPKVQRLFTGALFPEHINKALHQFSVRHNLKSSVWVPKVAFDYALKDYGVYILPSASLCNILMINDNDMQKGEMFLENKDHILVNAYQTSNCTFFENFTKYLVHQAAPDLHKNSGRKELFMFPVDAETGVSITSPTVINRLKEIQRRNNLKSNYWIKYKGPDKRETYYNAQLTQYPGRFNPVWSSNYIPRTYTGQRFPESTRRLMQDRAAHYGYVSRVWITLHEAYNIFQTKFRPEMANEGPVITTNYFTGGLDATSYYCTDQFEESELIFPTSQEISFAVSGVYVPSDKMRGFPVLYAISLGVEKAKNSLEVSPGPSRLGADTSMAEAQRHREFKEYTATYDHLSLFGVPTSLQEPILRANLGVTLRRECILRGFSTRHFISTRKIIECGFRVKSGEQGIVGKGHPSHLWGQAWLESDVWFNFSQLEEPIVALQLLHRPPTHLFTSQPLHGSHALNCCRLQILRDFPTSYWVPEWIIILSRWRLNPGATGVSYNAQPQGGASFFSFGTVLYNVAEIQNVSESDIRFVLNYRPADEQGRPYLRGARALMCIRALERQYTSPLWICLEAQSNHFLESCKLRPWEGGERPTALRRGALKSPPFVVVARRHFVNEEELVFSEGETLRDFLTVTPPSDQPSTKARRSAEFYVTRSFFKQPPQFTPNVLTSVAPYETLEEEEWE
ncbi:hypothetical protein ADEAN_000647100 [Angomonas deanei]|uniref:Trypanosoma Tc-38 (p38) protein domain-containing protein n=1 Tax=Angomonas deanei TaxID=59799 RepID=A0A7G2CGG2_9TRYP|nr:hypothetical protein ADEAN_000647100 [Angomonas deanei]